MSVVTHNANGEKDGTLIGFIGSLERLNSDIEKDGLDKGDVKRFVNNIAYDISGLTDYGVNMRRRKLLDDSKQNRLNPELKRAINNISRGNYSNEDISIINKNINKHSGWYPLDYSRLDQLLEKWKK